MFATSFSRRLLAECLSVAVLVIAGCGAIVVDAQSGSLGHVGVSLTFGLVIMVLVAAVGHISGAHLNPAVTVAFALVRHFPWREVPGYVVAQVTGAVLGAWALRGLFGLDQGIGATLPAGSVGQSLGLEILVTSILMFVITAVATDERAQGELAALAIGATVGLNALWAGPVSGASMNPARSFGPALVGAEWGAHWIYWVGPVLGAVVGAAAYQALRVEAGGQAEG